jgi:hypothetical protein
MACSLDSYYAVPQERPPNMGKSTALARTLIKDFWKGGKMPLFARGDKMPAKVFINLPRFLDACVEEQYRDTKPSRYWQLPEENRAIIIDDFHKLPNVRVLREKLLAEITKRFEIVILIGGAAIRFQELTGTESEANVLADFNHLEMLGFGHRLRSQLIRRWFLLGRTASIDDEEVDQQTVELEKVIGIVLGRDLLPPFPAYILLMLQEMELRKPIDTTAASYGKLYQAFMTACLATRRLDLETALSYLSELAFHFFEHKIDHLDDTGLILWHNRYVAEYQIPLDCAALRDELTAAGILAYRNGLLRFRVKAAFYFFVAQYLSSHLAQEQVQLLVKQLTSKLYRDDAANIILFLCHLNRDPIVLGEVLANAKRLFESVPEADLIEDVKFTGDLISRLAAPELPNSGDAEKRRQEMLEARDDAETDNDPTDEMYSYKHEEETDEDSETRRQVAQINAAMKTIQITGQIVRSFAGSLKGDLKRDLAESCYSLALRMLRFVFETFKFVKDDFGKALQTRYKRRFPKLTELQTAELANASIFMLVNLCAYGLLRHTSSSIGVERLAMTFNEIKQNKNTMGVRAIDIAIQLEHFKAFPSDAVIALYEDMSGVLLMQSVIQQLVWDRLYYFKTPHAVAQHVCSKIGIKLLPATFDADPKRG